MDIKWELYNPNNRVLPDCINAKKQKVHNTASNYTPPTETLLPDDLKDYTYSVMKYCLPDDKQIFMCNKNWTNNTSVDSQLNELPKGDNGECDKEKIKQALKIATKNITAMNNLAAEKINYGMHRKNINGFDLNLLLAPPEITYLLEKTDCIKEHRINTMGLIRKNTISSKNLKAINDDVAPLSCFEIKQNIDNQKQALKKLEQMPLNSKEDIIAALNAYKNITGTTFSYNGIMQSGQILDDKKFPKKDKIKEYTKLYGVPINYIEANKNRIATDIAYEVGLKYALPKGLMKVPTGVFWAPAMPLCIETGEVMSRGDKVFNTENFTPRETVRIGLDGAIKGAMVAAPTIPGAYSFINGPKNSLIPGIGQKSWNFIRNFGIRPARFTAVSMGQKAIVKAVRNNQESQKFEFNKAWSPFYVYNFIQQKTNNL